MAPEKENKSKIKNTDEINAAYREVLGRDADPSGLATYANKSPAFIRKSLKGSAEYELKTHGTIRPIKRNKGLEKGMSHDQFMEEWNQVSSRPPTQGEYENWVRWGKPKQLLVEKSGGSRKVFTDNGREITIYNDLTALGDKPFNFGYDGDLVAVPIGTKMKHGEKFKKIGEENGFAIYANGANSGGLLGFVADKTGIKEFETLRDKWMPKEFWGVQGPGGQIMAGTRAVEGQDNIADALGVKTEELQMANDFALRVAGSAFSGITGGLSYVAAESLIQAGDVATGTQDLEGAFTNIGISAIGAGISNSLQGVQGLSAAERGAMTGATTGAIRAGVDDENILEGAVKGGVSGGIGASDKLSSTEKALLAAGVSSASGGNTEQNLLSAGATMISQETNKAVKNQDGSTKIIPEDPQRAEMELDKDAMDIVNDVNNEDIIEGTDFNTVETADGPTEISPASKKIMQNTTR